MSGHPTGEQYEIAFADQQAVITEVGATLRAYRRAGRDLIHGFAADEIVQGGRGQNLLPWPNRIRDGQYRFAGRSQQLALTEPARHNASHGLARYVPWVLLDQQPHRVVHQVRIFPQTGWPGILEATITHELGPDGLRVDVHATNLGPSSLPFGYAAHPYLSVGADTVDEVSVSVPAAAYARVDEQLIPVSVEPVDGTDNDLRSGPVLGARNLDVAMTELSRADDGCWRVRAEYGERQTVLWGDASMRWVQIFTGGPHRDWGVAVEPMTCAANAFNEGPTHADLLVLEPGESYAGSWGITGS